MGSLSLSLLRFLTMLTKVLFNIDIALLYLDLIPCMEAPSGAIHVNNIDLLKF